MKLTRILFAKTILRSGLLKTEQEITIRTPWGKLYALSWGKPSSQPVLLCHGMMDCCSTFRPLVNLLPEDYFYVSMELPGNGKSDRLPRGVRISVVDLVPSLWKIQEHFNWDKFTFIGHSLGCHVGTFFAAAYPGTITHAVHLDPRTLPSLLYQELGPWYLNFYKSFYDNYEKINAGVEMSKKYRYEEIRERMKKARNLTDDAMDHILERCLVPAGDGLYRISFDQRQRNVMFPPISKDQYKRLWTTTQTRILSIVLSQSMGDGYDFNPYILDDEAWPNEDHRHVVVDGEHDIHLNRPEVIVGYIEEFLKETREGLFQKT